MVEDLEKICRKFGQCAEIVLPKCKDKRFPQSCAGFAFVQFARKKDAENAFDALNLSEVQFLFIFFFIVHQHLLIPCEFLNRSVD